ncbi:MAG: hypothetical protein INR69_14025 [Mucilaginibacter polytrichastri]|nr:hypothetical protein [Mucilaginibacter polytrichastri]
MDPKTKGWVSYITVIGWVVAFASNQPPNRSEEASFHIRQSLGVILMGVASGILGRLLFFVAGIPGFSISNLLYVIVFAAWVIGLIYALQGERKLLPVVGAYFQDWFKGL